MVDSKTLRRFNETAEKWRDLAEKRRLHFEELQQSGRWKYYYTEAMLVRRLNRAIELVDIWEPILLGAAPEPPPSPTRAIRPAGAPRRSAA